METLSFAGDYIRAVRDLDAAYDLALDAELRRVAEDGYRIIGVDHCEPYASGPWVIFDYFTSEPLASGTGSRAFLDSWARIEADSGMPLRDVAPIEDEFQSRAGARLWDAVVSGPETLLPVPLAEALRDWRYEADLDTWQESGADVQVIMDAIRWAKARLDRIRALEHEGVAVVVAADNFLPVGYWEVTDWLRGTICARGSDGPEGLHRALRRRPDDVGLLSEIVPAAPDLIRALGMCVFDNEITGYAEHLGAILAWAGMDDSPWGSAARYLATS